MIKFIFKGLLRDRGRSTLPILVVTLGVMLTVFLYCYLLGVMGDMITFNANFSTGHVKIMTRAYAENVDQMPNDLALLNVSELIDSLHHDFPNMKWAERIKFGGLIDVPDSNGETRIQATAFGIAADLLTKNSEEIKRLNLNKALVSGRFPEKSDEILLSNDFAKKMEIGIGQTVTLITSTMNGEMSIQNFVVSGTIKFGSPVLDRGGIIADIRGIQNALDMENACGEILGYLNTEVYYDEAAKNVTDKFNSKYSNPDDEFSPIMKRLKDQAFLATYLDMVDAMQGIVITIFIIIMSIVLWNTGLIGGLRRYGEVGIRLAMGEEKGHIYKSMIYESILIGIIGSIIGTALGLFFSYLMQEIGIDISGMMKNNTIMMQSVIRAKITPPAFYIGFIPGIFSIVIGTMLAGIGIYKRKTAQLFKELEV
ncbi:MAG: FtsX-like permease family protein [Chlorobi bacterium]|nr:FtsX-like permease family protein [Chlorobiota bacterium]